MTAALPYLPLSGIVSLFAALLAVLRLAIAGRGDIVDGPAETKEDCVPVVYVISAAILMYYMYLFNQSMVGFVELNAAKKAYREKKTKEKPSMARIKYGQDNFNILAANRCVVNFHEQLPPFLVALCLHSTYVSVSGAVTFGWLWLFFRSYYLPAFKHTFAKNAPTMFLSTMPAYGCVWWMLGRAVYEASKKS